MRLQFLGIQSQHLAADLGMEGLDETKVCERLLLTCFIDHSYLLMSVSCFRFTGPLTFPNIEGTNEGDSGSLDLLPPTK